MNSFCLIWSYIFIIVDAGVLTIVINSYQLSNYFFLLLIPLIMTTTLSCYWLTKTQSSTEANALLVHVQPEAAEL